MERGRQRGPEDGMPAGSGGRKRSRSDSSYSSDSVSTISTSHSISPKRSRFESQDDYTMSQQDQDPIPQYRSVEGKKRRNSSYSRSYSSDSSHHRPLSRGPTRNTRRRRKTISPERRGRSNSQGRRRRSRTRSRSHGLEKSRIAKERYSMTPQREEPAGGRYQGSAKHNENWKPLPEDRSMGTQRRSVPVRKERSLSPYSKRLALTQAMNMGP